MSTPQDRMLPIPADLYEALAARAAARGLSPEAYAAQVLREALARDEADEEQITDRLRSLGYID